MLWKKINPVSNALQLASHSFYFACSNWLMLIFTLYGQMVELKKEISYVLYRIRMDLESSTNTKGRKTSPRVRMAAQCESRRIQSLGLVGSWESRGGG